MWIALREVCNTSDTSNTVSSTMSYCTEANGGIGCHHMVLCIYYTPGKGSAK